MRLEWFAFLAWWAVAVLTWLIVWLVVKIEPWKLLTERPTRRGRHRAPRS